MEKQISIFDDTLKILRTGSIRKHGNHSPCMYHSVHCPFGYDFMLLHVTIGENHS